MTIRKGEWIVHQVADNAFLVLVVTHVGPKAVTVKKVYALGSSAQIAHIKSTEWQFSYSSIRGSKGFMMKMSHLIIRGLLQDIR